MEQYKLEKPICGGMPAAVLAHAQQRGLQAVRRIHNQIISDYRRNFSKHAPAREVQRINMVWNSIPAQLAKENKKFIYGAVKKSARASEFELAIQWLEDAGLASREERDRDRFPHANSRHYRAHRSESRGECEVEIAPHLHRQQSLAPCCPLLYAALSAAEMDDKHPAVCVWEVAFCCLLNGKANRRGCASKPSIPRCGGWERLQFSIFLLLLSPSIVSNPSVLSGGRRVRCGCLRA